MEWILLVVLTVGVGIVMTARIVRVRQISRPTVADPERVADELLEFVVAQSRYGRVVDLRPFWEGRRMSEADRWAVQGPLHGSGRLLPAEEDTSFLGRLREYVRCSVPEQVILG